MPRPLTVTPGTPCRSCARPLRPGRAPKTLHPGTVMHKAQGLCGNCHLNPEGPSNYDLDAPLVIYGYDDPDPDVRRTARELNAWLLDRHLRGIPTKGIEA